MQDKIAQANKIQKQATNINHNIYLAASAGTGKTKTLIDRILVTLLHGAKFKNILSITYTNAAANEMLERLCSKLKQWHAKDNSYLQEDLTNLLGTPPTKHMLELAGQLYNNYLDNYEYSKIQTIHSLCIEILNKYHQLHGLANNKISLIDDFRKKQFMQTAFEQTIIDAKHNEILDNAINKLACKYNYQSLYNLLQNILEQKQKLYSFMQSANDLAALVKQQFVFYAANVDNEAKNILQSFLLEDVKACTDFIEHHDIYKHIELKTFVSWHCGDKTHREILFTPYLDFFVTKTWQARKKIPLKKEFLDHLPDFAEIYLAEQTRIMNFLQQKNCQEQAEFMQHAIILLNHIAGKYEQQKKSADLVDFDDLILNTLELLSSHNDIPALLISLDQEVHHLLIDEAQDLSNIQWLVIQKIISGMENKNSSIFIIGDYKQSIYSFQGAEPEYFLQIKELCQNLHQIKKQWVSLELTHSFRSQTKILEIVDQFFINNNYFPNIKHLAIKEAIGKFNLIEFPKEKTQREKHLDWNIPKLSPDKINYKQQIADEIAKFVAHLLTDRPDLNPQDIMVLFKKRGEKMTYLIEQLSNYKIAVSQINKVDFQKNLVILDLLSLLKFVTTPTDDLNLAGLLKSPFFRLTTKQIHDLIYPRNDEKIWQFLLNSNHAYASVLQESIIIWQQESLYNFYSNFLFKQNYIKNFYAYFGQYCEKVINLFLQKILEYEASLDHGSHSFLKWLEDNAIVSNETMYPDAMKVITTHAAKGLQAKIVIIADADESENTPKEDFFWHNEQLVIPYNHKANYSFIEEVKSIRKQTIRNESLRLLYVAMTRAENELYVFGTEDCKLGCWFSDLKKEFPEHLLKAAALNKTPSKQLQRKKKKTIPEYFYHKHITNNTGLKKSQASSQQQTHDDIAVMRGEFIHKLLADLTLLPQHSMHQYAQHLAKSSFALLNTDEIPIITDIAVEILEKFPHLFNHNNLFELKLKQRLEQNLYTVQIDLLAMQENNIQIVEIKSDIAKKLRADHIPNSYLEQLSIYKKCVESIYPNHKIACFILSFFQKKIFPIEKLNV